MLCAHRMTKAVLLTAMELCVLAGERADRNHLDIDAVLSLTNVIQEELQVRQEENVAQQPD